MQHTNISRQPCRHGPDPPPSAGPVGDVAAVVVEDCIAGPAHVDQGRRMVLGTQRLVEAPETSSAVESKERRNVLPHQLDVRGRHRCYEGCLAQTTVYRSAGGCRRRCGALGKGCRTSSRRSRRRRSGEFGRSRSGLLRALVALGLARHGPPYGRPLLGACSFYDDGARPRDNLGTGVFSHSTPC